MYKHENPDSLNGTEEPSDQELMFLEYFSHDPNGADAVLVEEVGTSEDAYAQGEAVFVRGNVDKLLANTPYQDETVDVQDYD